MGRRDTKNICSKVFMPEQLRGGLVYTKIQSCPVRGYSAYMSTEATMPMICCDTVPEQIVGKEHPKMVRPLPRRSLTEVAGGHQRQGRAIFLAGSVFPIFLAGSEYHHVHQISHVSLGRQCQRWQQDAPRIQTGSRILVLDFQA